MVKLKPSSDDLTVLSRLLRKVEFFSALSVAQIDNVLRFILFYGYKKGETIFKQGELGDAFYVVYDGQLEVSMKKWLLGFPHKLAVLKAGDCFGEMALLDGSARTATVRTTAPSRLFALTRSDFDFFLGENPVFAEEIKRIAERRKFEDRGR
ncbi:MAG: cyclic nucleotide-binding domain-containing protein [Elusimicrobia bacterium]|nr:cyclic nucleotide-binding domain-containing protein [Elusimicrobiota bacterium]